MFTQYFGWKYNPFTKENPVSELYRGSDFNELDSRLQYILSTRGIFLLTAESGAGKTTALRNFCNDLNSGLYKSCYYSLTKLR